MKTLALTTPTFDSSSIGNEVFNFKQVLLYTLYTHSQKLIGLLKVPFRNDLPQQVELVPVKKRVPWVNHCLTHMENSLKSITSSKHLEYIDVYEMIESLVDKRRRLAAATGVELRLNVGYDNVIFSNKYLLQVIIGNLLDNSIQFSNNEKQRKYTYIEVKSTPTLTHITIEDNGVGIPYKEVNNIFKKFYQVTQSSPGVGIGLFLVKKALKKLGGSIDVMSSKNFGTEFHIQLPVTSFSNVKPAMYVHR